MTQTHTQDLAGIDPRELYNLIMRQIEPELTTEMLPLLDEMYASEDPEDRKKRMQKYMSAFEQFEIQHKKFVDGWKAHYTGLRKKADGLVRDVAERDDKSDVGDIEHSIQDS